MRYPITAANLPTVQLLNTPRHFNSELGSVAALGLRRPAGACPNDGKKMLSDEIRYRILSELERDPRISQRALANALGVSVGKANYCIRALVDKGLIKVRNFRKSGNKLAYAYQLTPRGVKDKATVTRRFLQVKLREYESLQAEIEELRREVDGHESTSSHKADL